LKGVLKFRFKSGSFSGKSLFQSCVPDYFMETVWGEIENNVQDALNILYDDGNFLFIIYLETSLGCFMGKAT